MSSKLAWAAISASLMTAAAHAETATLGWTGDISTSLAHQSWSGDDNMDVGFGELALRVARPLSGPWAVQFEGRFGGVLPGDRDAAYDQALYLSHDNFGAHLLYRTEGYQLGLMAGIASASVDDNEDYFDGLLGVEGQTWLGQSSLWGQAAYTHGYEEYRGNEELQLLLLRGGVRYFLNDNTKLDAEATLADGSFDGNDATITMVGVGAEHRFASGPNYDMSVFGRLESSYFDYTDYGSSDWLRNNSIRVGLNIQFGHQTLREADRNGANTSLPDFGTFNIIDSTY